MVMDVLNWITDKSHEGNNSIIRGLGVLIALCCMVGGLVHIIQALSPFH
jgi:hypothetical protein